LSKKQGDSEDASQNYKRRNCHEDQSSRDDQ
jgi:hypothetical protein